MLVRRLTRDDLGAYRALHRFALTESPLAFVETPRDDDAHPDATVAEMLARGEGWGVFEGERLLGKLVINAPPYGCLAHTRWLHAVYLHPEARGKGAGDALLDAALGQAKAEGARRVALWMNEKNLHAQRMYGRRGFVVTGRVPGGILVDGGYVDDVLMCLDLAP